MNTRVTPKKRNAPAATEAFQKATSSEEIMGKTTEMPLSVNFPRHHQLCDHCGKPASWHLSEAARRERQTAAGTFPYQICTACIDKIEGMARSRREAAYTRAIVRHAMHYSVDYGRFVAGWFGVNAARLGGAAR